MGAIVVSGATLLCPFGTAPGTLNVTSQGTCLGTAMMAATIMDMSPGSNITPFGMCCSLSNPQVAAATAAAMGVLTPQPCTMVPAGPWQSVKPDVMIGGKPVLTQESKLMCGTGMGQISIVAPGQMKILAD